jgi:membrane protein implicated in regulation of membrane protease activity
MAFTLYAALAVFGILFVGWSLVSGDDGGQADLGGDWALFSLRSLAFGSLAFGAVGLIGTMAKWSAPLTFSAAAALGGVTWVGVAALFRYLRQSQSGALRSDDSWLGSEAVLVMPFGNDGVGKISLSHGGQVIELAARRAPEFQSEPAAHFRRCRIDDFTDNTAVVVPLEPLLTS